MKYEEKHNKYIIALRLIHTAFAVYFITCVVYIYYVALTLQMGALFGIAVLSLCLEGFFVFILNHGHCPLAPLQRRLKDPVPFFNLFLPDDLAKKAIPFFTSITFLGIIILVVRLYLHR